MTTKTPSPVQRAPEGALERIAYASVAEIPTADPHDRDRLGYNVWRWLKAGTGGLEVAVRTAGARLLISDEEAVRKIREQLKAQGVAL